MTDDGYLMENAIIYMDKCISYLVHMGFDVKVLSSPAKIVLKNHKFVIAPGDFVGFGELCSILEIPPPTIEEKNVFTWIQLLYTMPADSISVKILVKISKGRYRRSLRFSRNPIKLINYVKMIRDSQSELVNLVKTKKRRWFGKKNRASSMRKSKLKVKGKKRIKKNNK